jgi:hypothetical protein
MKARGSSVRSGYLRPAPNVRSICRVCNQPLGMYHDKRKCEELWLRQCEEEAAKSKQGG